MLYQNTVDEQKTFNQAYKRESLERLSQSLRFLALRYAPVIYCSFWILDNIYAPEHRWLFLMLRLSVFPFELLAFLLAPRLRSILMLQLFICSMALIHSTPLVIMMSQKEGLGSPYFSGLMLIVIGIMGTIPLSVRAGSAVVLFTFAPYFLWGLFKVDSNTMGVFFSNIFISAGTLAAVAILTYFQDKLRKSEFESRWKLGIDIGTRDSIIRQKTAENLTLEVDASLGKLSAQVAHDIRSPLSALEVFASTTKDVPEEKRILMKLATERIRDIANNLLSRSSVSLTRSRDSVEHFSGVVEALVAEKRLEYSGYSGLRIILEINPSCFADFVKVKSSDLKRVLSNLINNSAESLLNMQGVVKIILNSSKNFVSVEVSDTGRGIPSDILPLLSKKQFSHGKDGGTGIGLLSARQNIESWNGNLEIVSEVGKGTQVKIEIPKTAPPKWFVASLEISKHKTIVVVDDDPSIHEIWRQRLSSTSHSGEIIHESSTSGLRRLLERRSTHETLFLIDHEFRGELSTGLNTIATLGISAFSILVTSRYEDAHIQGDCVRNDIGILPKNMAGFVPIRIK